jgi:hypothetical protein
MLTAKNSKRLISRNQKQFLMSKVQGYWQARERFKKLLLAVVYIGCEPPAQGEKITLIRFQNGFLQAHNIYVVNGRLLFVTRYHKS